MIHIYNMIFFKAKENYTDTFHLYKILCYINGT